MKIKLIILLLLGITINSIGQNLNLIIEVNERLVVGEIAEMYLNFENTDGTKSRNLVGYLPGELILEKEDWAKIRDESTQKITLTFDYYALKGRYHNSVNFEMEMEKNHFEKNYLILKVYDFRERKFRRQYQCLTDKEYIAEWNFAQSGILIRCK